MLFIPKFCTSDYETRFCSNVVAPNICILSHTNNNHTKTFLSAHIYLQINTGGYKNSKQNSTILFWKEKATCKHKQIK